MPLIKFFLIPCNEFNQVTKLTFFTLKTSYFYLWYSPMFVELTKRLDFSELRPTPTNLTANPALPFMLPQFTSLLCRSEYHNFRHNLSSLSKPFQGKTAVYYWNLKQVLEDIVTTKKNKKTKKNPKKPKTFSHQVRAQRIECISSLKQICSVNICKTGFLFSELQSHSIRKSS